MKTIKLTQNKFAIVDDDDYDEISRYKWTFIKDNKSGHAYRKINGKSTYMHRVILNAKPKQIVDHINLNGLDNRKENLRFVTARGNAINKGLQINNTSGYSGIHWDKQTNRWMVRIKLYGKSKNLGRFVELPTAIKARKEGKIKYDYI